MALSSQQIAAIKAIAFNKFGVEATQTDNAITITTGWSYVHFGTDLATYKVSVSIDIKTGAVTSDCVVTCLPEVESMLIGCSGETPRQRMEEASARCLNDLTDKVAKAIFTESKERMTEAKEKANAMAFAYCLEMNQPQKHKAFARVSNIIYRAIWAKKPISEKRIARMFAIANAA